MSGQCMTAADALIYGVGLSVLVLGGAAAVGIIASLLWWNRHRIIAALQGQGQ